ncbi:GNAT family N-acetyltransferase [Streptomyces sp. NA02950]|uniref:GNAT family N-acetyltransferase n=1 Tax=Streptomyces sp. NA02950 TaxID=2742137 RepID=UPI001591100E|nr:GNAT family N-acetyltransferase [Streptomyces sp. NA02950]QKV96932.1 GNAT family N-acetyltransferase [Streptomyces sp. NA02950]
MPTLFLAPIRFSAQELSEVAGLYASNPSYCRAAGEYDPERIPGDRLEDDLREEAGTDGCEVLLARDTGGRLVGLVCLLDRHPVDGFPWIGLLMVHGNLRRRGVGRQLTAIVEERLRKRHHHGIRLAVLENTPSSTAFWSSLGWREIDRRPDNQHGRPCVVMHKQLA